MILRNQQNLSLSQAKKDEEPSQENIQQCIS